MILPSNIIVGSTHKYQRPVYSTIIKYKRHTDGCGALTNTANIVTNGANIALSAKNNSSYQPLTLATDANLAANLAARFSSRRILILHVLLETYPTKQTLSVHVSVLSSQLMRLIQKQRFG